jgi:sugar lactone lactonase YvrE
VTGIACDPKTGNVYVSFLYSYAGPGGIDEYPAGLAGKATTLPMDPAFPAGIAVDKAGDILVCEAFAGTVEYYHPTVANSFKEVKGFASPSGVALEKSDSYMWVADQQANKLYRVQIKTQKIVDTITKPGYKSLAGVATVPADH